MSLSSFDSDLDIISKLDDQPNDVGGLTPAELKARFDSAGNLIKDYLNNTLIPELRTKMDVLDGLSNVLGSVTGVQTDSLKASDTDLASVNAILNQLQNLGGGDMMQSMYDTDGDGKVDKAAYADEATSADHLSSLIGMHFTGAITGSASFDGTAKNMSFKVDSFSPDKLNGYVPISKGGTGATTATAAFKNLVNSIEAKDIASADMLLFALSDGTDSGKITVSNLMNTLATMGLVKKNSSGAVPISSGGTGATTTEAARNNLGLGNTAGPVPVANGGTGATTTEAAVNALGILEYVYPVGSVYISTVDKTPADLFGFGTWERIEGRFLLSSGTTDNGDGITYKNGATDGYAKHTLTVDEMPKHSHKVSGNHYSGDGSYGISSGSHTIVGNQNTTSTGGGSAHNNMPPYLVVCMWKRTA